MHNPNYISTVNIPAHDATGNGLVVELRLKIMTNRKFSTISFGNVASALERNFQHVIEIMSAIKKSWECLESCSYILECSYDNFIVKDSKSSSVALSILLLNVYRAMCGKKHINGLTGSGILRIDGSFQNASHEAKKHLAAIEKIGPIGRFIAPAECGHLYELEELMNQY